MDANPGRFGHAGAAHGCPDPRQVGELSVNPELCAENAVTLAIFEHSYDDRVTHSADWRADDSPPAPAGGGRAAELVSPAINKY